MTTLIGIVHKVTAVSNQYHRVTVAHPDHVSPGVRIVGTFLVESDLGDRFMGKVGSAIIATVDRFGYLNTCNTEIDNY